MSIGCAAAPRIFSSRRTSLAAGAFACLLVQGQAGGATVDAAGGATVDVRTAAAGGAAAARDPRHLFDFSTNHTCAKERVFKAVRRPAR